MQLKKKMNSSLINTSKEEEEIVENFENKYEFCCFGPIPEDRPIPMPLFIKHHKNPNFDKHSSNLSFSCERVPQKIENGESHFSVHLCFNSIS